MEPLNWKEDLNCDGVAKIGTDSNSRSSREGGEGRSGTSQCKCNACACETGNASIQPFLARGQALHEELRAWGDFGTARLQKLVRAELSFLNRLAGVQLQDNPPSLSPALRSSNLDHLEDVFRILRHPQVSGVSGVMQSLSRSEDGPSMPPSQERYGTSTYKRPPAHVDIACLLGRQPAWLIVSSRNPRYIRWSEAREKKHEEGVRERLLRLLEVAHADSAKMPRSIFLCFRGQVPQAVDHGLKEEFSAFHLPRGGRAEEEATSSNSFQESTIAEVEDGEWVYVDCRKEVLPWNASWEAYRIDLGTSKKRAANIDAVETKTQNCEVQSKTTEGCLHNKEIGPSSELPCQADCDRLGEPTTQQSAMLQTQGVLPVENHTRIINLDTTALVALVSEISNGGANRLLAMSQEDIEKRFRNMSAFIREQVLSELNRPLVPEIEEAIACCQAVVPQLAHDEFMSIVSQIGGPREKGRATALLQRVRVIPDAPSARVMSLPLSGRIKQRHRVIFGTGECLGAPTLTANMAFIRAARSQGTAIAAVEHRPRALTGD